MKTLYLVAATFLGVAACVTSGPESPVPAANAGDSVTNSNSTAAAGQLEVADVPEVPISVYIPTQDELICRIERSTGLHTPKRVCRTRAEINEARVAAQNMFNQLRNIAGTKNR